MKVAISGGTGFVGVHLARALIDSGHSVRLLVRSRVYQPAVGALEYVQADLSSAERIAPALEGCDAMVSLAGILHQSKLNSFEDVHHQLPLKLANAAIQAGIDRMTHVSALHADINGPSEYLKSKGRAEQSLSRLQDKLSLSFHQPSVIFGAGDDLINQFAALLKFAPVMPLARGNSLFQPVYIGDLATAIALDLTQNQPDQPQTHQWVGPERLSLVELVQTVAKHLSLKRWIFALPDPIGAVQAAALGMLPNPPMTLDNYRSLSVNSVADGPTCPSRLDEEIPKYLFQGSRDDQARQLWAALEYAAGG
ncbi:MAG: complex I NDUFA9 subunit family protein [Gammaproteobacteria bacterium]|nr:complex I NDUFA9 subunit family protein [Gammaproteobacteria bacterium]